MKYVLALFVLLAACGDDSETEVTEPTAPVEAADDLNICERAAERRAECVGDYVTPPACDTPDAEARAQELLDTPCESFESEFEATGKADGAFCDWFGAGCTPDEPIFAGPECSSDADCSTGFCVEEHCFEGVTSDEFAETLDIFTESVELQGSQTQLLTDNAETRQLRRDLVEQAVESVHFSAFIIQDDETGNEMVQIFSDAAQRGVEVRVLIDATTQYVLADYALLQKMAMAGVEVLAWNPVTEWVGLRQTLSLTANDRLHEKMLIVDGREVVIGGRNVGDEYLMADRWRDTDVYVAGGGVEGIQRMYLEDWDRVSALERASGCESQADWGFSCPPESIADEPGYYPELEELGTARTRAIYSDPLNQPTPNGYLTTLALVRAARTSITIANSYFVPPRRLRRHLKAAVERGVEVRVLTNSLESTDAWWMYYASINFYKELIGAGVQIFQYTGTETMHAKTMLIDDELAVVGSFNLDPRSAIDNSEAMVLITEGEAVEQLRQAMDEDLAVSERASDDIPIGELLKARSLRLVEPLL